METLLDVMWSLRGLVGILVGVMVLARGVKAWRKAKKTFVILAGVCSLGASAVAADGEATCYQAACDPETQHCMQLTSGSVGYYCEAGPEPWYSAAQAAEGSLRSQWLIALTAGLLLFVCFSTRFKV